MDGAATGPEGDHLLSQFVDRVRVCFGAAATTAEARIDEARQRGGIVDCGLQIYERDRDSTQSVLGSAIALRLFLFVIPATVALVGLINVLRLGSLLQDDLEASATTGSISRTLSGMPWGQAWWIFLSGGVLTLMAGRPLSKVLAASSGRAWNMTVRESKVSPLAIVALTGVLFAQIASSAIFHGLRDVPGFAVALTAWLSAIASATVSWFLVMLVLPRAVRDPGALLPGAAALGLVYTVLQWFMQLYLLNKVERTSDTFGDLALTVATLGNFFFVGRIMAGSFVFTAVAYERWGSLSQVVFELPGMRGIARRSPKLRRYFNLDLAALGTLDEPVTHPAVPDVTASSIVDRIAADTVGLPKPSDAA